MILFYIFTYFSLVRACSSQYGHWAPKSGEYFGLVINELGISREDVERLNPKENIDNIFPNKLYTVPYEKPKYSAAWLTGCPPTLQLSATTTPAASSPAALKSEAIATSSTPTPSVPQHSSRGSSAHQAKTRSLSTTAQSTTDSSSSEPTSSPSTPPKSIYTSKPQSSTETTTRTSSDMPAVSDKAATTTSRGTKESTGSSSALTAENRPAVGTGIEEKSGATSSSSSSVTSISSTALLVTSTTSLGGETMTQPSQTTGSGASSTIVTTASNQNIGTSYKSQPTTLTTRSKQTSTLPSTSQAATATTTEQNKDIYSQYCFNEADAENPKGTSEEGVSETANEWCNSHSELSMGKGDRRLIGIGRHNNVLYEYFVVWVDGCTGPDQDVFSPLGFSKDSCYALMTGNWKKCNNGGAGGHIRAGCLVYQLRAGVGKAQGY